MCRTKTSHSPRAKHLERCSLIEQSQRRDLKDVTESTTGIIPGDRGKAGDNWCRPPLHAAKADERHISPVPLAGVVSGQSTHESGTEPQGAIRNRVERSQAHGAFRPVRRRSYPRGLWLLLRRPERSHVSRRDDPAKRPDSPHETGTQGRRDGGERADLGKVRQPPLSRRREKRVTSLQKRTQPES